MRLGPEVGSIVIIHVQGVINARRYDLCDLGEEYNSLVFTYLACQNSLMIFVFLVWNHLLLKHHGYYLLANVNEIYLL